MLGSVAGAQQARRLRLEGAGQCVSRGSVLMPIQSSQCRSPAGHDTRDGYTGHQQNRLLYSTHGL